ncbi:DUF4296 domain-containing protein [Carboxylicivirga taeanensis]|uniref:DUF4296 domain-containing protein n=1 Tax=Carboxylicivirga taeanensis TaxID=1416875 RepID=UPI003F6E1558
MRYFFYTLLLVFLISSCSTRPKVPADLPDEDEMALVLADIYHLESVLGQTRLSYNTSQEDKLSGYYRYVLEKHHISKAEFDTAMVWYSANPTVLADVYDEVIEILSRRDAELKNKMNKEKEIQNTMPKVAGRVDLWNDTTAFQIPFNEADSLDNRVPFSIDVDSLSGGIIRLYASYLYKEGGYLDSAKMKMIAVYADSTMDTVSYKIHKSFKQVSGNISHKVERNQALININGFLLEHDTSKQTVVNICDVKLNFLPTIGIDEMELP